MGSQMNNKSWSRLMSDSWLMFILILNLEMILNRILILLQKLHQPSLLLANEKSHFKIRTFKLGKNFCIKVFQFPNLIGHYWGCLSGWRTHFRYWKYKVLRQVKTLRAEIEIQLNYKQLVIIVKWLYMYVTYFWVRTVPVPPL